MLECELERRCKQVFAIKNRMVELMNYFGLKQNDIVEKTGIPKSAISMYVSGQRSPRQNRLTIIADAYGVNETWLMGYDVPMFKGNKEKLDEIQKTSELFGELFQSSPLEVMEVMQALKTDSKWMVTQSRFCQEMNQEQKEKYLSIGKKIIKGSG